MCFKRIGKLRLDAIQSLVRTGAPRPFDAIMGERA